MAPESGKLVRDRIPQIIRASGLEPSVYRAGSAEYSRRLRAKLVEEVDEVLAADSESLLDELADVFEVLCALASEAGVDEAGLWAAAAAKAEKRGGFSERWVWTGNSEPAAAGG
ncbi:nucleoside triphosphate pyrophosphohydrolase [Streptomyces sp. CA-111067]|uniref:nucleoside triphosphate pyrophosphohydrolase n=1 Tax=Streptomyces sp. CA-111067 TaxID=3240046 RepID=UPI003D983E3A